MQFIDFEYAWWGFRGFDIANHFCEYAGFECDYSRYPDQDQAALFMRHYLSEDSGHEPVRPWVTTQISSICRCFVSSSCGISCQNPPAMSWWAPA